MSAWLPGTAVSAARARTNSVPAGHRSARGRWRAGGGGVVLFCACVCVFSPVYHVLLVFPTEQPQFRSPAP